MPRGRENISLCLQQTSPGSAVPRLYLRHRIVQAESCSGVPQLPLQTGPRLHLLIFFLLLRKGGLPHRVHSQGVPLTWRDFGVRAVSAAGARLQVPVKRQFQPQKEYQQIVYRLCLCEVPPGAEGKSSAHGGGRSGRVRVRLKARGGIDQQ